jgi:hypothetical protein
MEEVVFDLLLGFWEYSTSNGKLDLSLTVGFSIFWKQVDKVTSTIRRFT